MARISYTPPKGLSDIMYLALGDGRFLQVQEGTLDYTDAESFQLKKSTNSFIQQMIRDGMLNIQLDGPEQQYFDVGGNGLLNSSNGVRMAPLTPMDVGLGPVQGNGQPVMTNYQAMQTAANAHMNGNNGILMPDSAGNYTPNGQAVVTAIDQSIGAKPQQNNLNPTMNPQGQRTYQGVAPEFQNAGTAPQGQPVQSPPIAPQQVINDPPPPQKIDASAENMIPQMQSESTRTPEDVSASEPEMSQKARRGRRKTNTVT